MTRQEIESSIYMGQPVTMDEAEYKNGGRNLIGEIGAQFLDQGQDLRGMIALEEVKRLDEKHNFSLLEPQAMTTPTVDLNQWSAQTVMQWERGTAYPGDGHEPEVWHDSADIVMEVSGWHPLTNSDQAREVARKVVETLSADPNFRFGYAKGLPDVGLLAAAEMFFIEKLRNVCAMESLQNTQPQHAYCWISFDASNEAILQACYLVYGHTS